MLVMDMCCGHLSDKFKSRLKNEIRDLAVTCGGMRSQLQLLSVCINKSSKDWIRTQYSQMCGSNNALNVQQ